MDGHPPYRLPKTIASDPRAQSLLRALENAPHCLWPGSPLHILEADLSEPLREALLGAHRAGRVVRSLEKAQAVLSAEAHGQRLVDRRSGTARGTRISRLLVLTNDGAERFYRQAESLLKSHESRLVGVRLKVDAETLGEALFGRGRTARLLMIEHKTAVGTILLTLADQWVDANDGQ